MADRLVESRQDTRNRKDRPPAFRGWLSTDEQEVERRRWRGRTEVLEFERLEPGFEFYGTYRVAGSAGRSYTVEVRHLRDLSNSCTCQDFANAGLGTCKHVEGVLHRLRETDPHRFEEAATAGSPRIEVFLADDPEPSPTVVAPTNVAVPGLGDEVRRLAATLCEGSDLDALAGLRALADANSATLRVSLLLDGWAERKRSEAEREARRTRVLAAIDAGRLTVDNLKYSLFPYQVKGVLHLALGGRVMLADDMGLGKTVQAIGATELLARIGEVERVLVVCPTSLKSEWAEQIAGATDRETQLVQGLLPARLAQYAEAPFYTVTNYEQVRNDLAHIQRLVRPDLVILDEAQRIKNWRTKTADSVKRLESRFAFVLTGTPLENRIDEVYSIAQYLDPDLLGPLFRFNRRYYVLDDRGRPVSLKHLDELHRRIGTVMLRRRKDDIEQELPDRVVNNFYLPMTEVQADRYADYEAMVVRLASIARSRPLSDVEFKRMQGGLACMRMLCDTAYILDPTERDCPKLEELERILEDLLSDPTSKVIVFSEWVRMLSLVRERLQEMGVEYAWHTGSVPQQKRRAEIQRFKEDPDCRVFLSSESGGAGLNLQAANAVINVDLPWNPAKLEQRIARAWRKHQKRTVHVVNLVAENTIEHRMLGVLEAKQGLSDAVLDGATEDGKLELPSGRKALLERLEELLAQPDPAAPPKPVAEDPVASSLTALREAYGEALFAVELRKDRSEGKSLLVVLQPVEGAEPADPESIGCALPVTSIDRTSYESMLRMEEAGMLDFSATRLDVVYRETPEDRAEVETRRNRERAQAHLAEAVRLQKMAVLLSGGGFEAEAGKQAGPIAVAAIRALAADSGLDAGDDSPAGDALLATCGQLIEAGVLTAELEATAARLCMDAVGEIEDSVSFGAGRDDSGTAAGLEGAGRILDVARNRLAA